MHTGLLSSSYLVWRKCGKSENKSLRAEFNHSWKDWIKSSLFFQSYGRWNKKSHWVENVCFSKAKSDGRAMRPGNESRPSVSTPWYGGCWVALVVHETGRAAVPKLRNLPVWGNISEVFSNTETNWEISPKRRDSLLLWAHSETSANRSFAPFIRRLFSSWEILLGCHFF